MTRAAVAYCLVAALLVGLPATVVPGTFFDAFPFVASWVDELPPYNQHLVTDVGGLYLGFALLLGWSLARRELVVCVCSAFALAQGLHLLFHVTHLGGFGVRDAVAQTAALAALTVAPLVAVAGARRAQAQPGAASTRQERLRSTRS